MDNTSVNLGICESIKVRVQARNCSVYFSGCSCHVLHNAAQKGAEQFSVECGLGIEEFVVNLFYWFDKSSKRKNLLLDYCQFCDHSYRSVIKHVSTRWLSLELAIERSLKQFPGLTSYFKSEDEVQGRFKRLQKNFQNPMLEVYLLFLQSVLPILTNANKLLQWEEPLIHVLRSQLVSLLKKVMAKFVKPCSISDAESRNILSSFSFDDESHHLALGDIWIGFHTKQLLSRLLRDGNISDHAHTKFLRAARTFLVKVAKYLQKWCPIDDELLVSADKQQKKTFMAVEFFVSKFPHLFQDMDMDKLAEQFMAYQVLPATDIPISVKTDLGLDPDNPYHADALWAYLNSRRVPGTNRPEFDLLFKIASAVLTILHSNFSVKKTLCM